MLLILALLPVLLHAKRLPQIYWNSTNPLVERYAAIGDTLDILCPFFEEGSDEITEQSIIYRVSEEEYENCERKSAAKELGRCTQPYQRDKLKVAFRLMSPNPSGLDYRPGTTYYFISTSTGSANGLENEHGGLCASHNLKMVIHITDRNGDISGHHHRHHHKKATPTIASPPSTPTSTTIPSTTSSSSSIANLEKNAEKMWEEFYQKVMPIENNWPEVSRAERVTLFAGNKKSDEYEQIPAEVMDFEIHEIGDVESLYSSSTSTSTSTVLQSRLLLLLLACLWIVV